MYRLMIVDNERLIVENLVDLFVKSNKLQLEVYGVYSSREALELMARVKIDIVLSDIHMPEMNGLELQQEIIKQWPRCKIIFLSGYDDFEYIQQALRNDSVDYLLKTEGEQTILQTVEKAVNQLKEAMEADRLIEGAKKQMQAAKPVLQKEYLWSLIQGDASVLRNLDLKFKELQLTLTEDEPVLLVIGRVDDWRDDFSYTDRELMLFAIQNIADEYLGASTQSLPIVFDNNKMIWMIQPKKENGGSAKMREALWIRTVRFVQGMAEMIQQSCMELLKLKLSFAMANEARGWDKAAEQFDTLKLMLSCGLGLGQESILLDRNQIGEIFPRGYNHELRAELKRFESLAVFLENGQKQHFFKEYVRLTSLVDEAHTQVESLKLEIHVTLAAIFLSYINRWGLLVEIGDRHDLSKLGRFDRHLSWRQTADYYAQLAESLFDMKWNGQIYQENDVIKHIQWYVDQNLAGELSLTRIGEVVGHNPYYLSKLYKQITGEGLSVYIMNFRLKRAKELLTQNVLKISDISKSVGFLSEQSFYRFFKKAAGITPQEFKNTRMEEEKR